MGLGFMVFNITFNNISVICGIQTHNSSFENMYDACTCIALLTKYIAEFKFRKKIPCLTVYLMFDL